MDTHAPENVDTHAPNMVIVDTHAPVAECRFLEASGSAFESQRTLVSFIENCDHPRFEAYIWRLIEFVFGLEKLPASSRRDFAGRMQDLQRSWSDHRSKEEEILFPMIRAGSGSHAQGLVQILEREHEDQRKALETLRIYLTGSSAVRECAPEASRLADCLQRFSQEMIEHFYLEDKVLFPHVLRATEEIQ